MKICGRESESVCPGSPGGSDPQPLPSAQEPDGGPVRIADTPAETEVAPFSMNPSSYSSVIKRFLF